MVKSSNIVFLTYEDKQKIIDGVYMTKSGQEIVDYIVKHQQKLYLYSSLTYLGYKNMGQHFEVISIPEIQAMNLSLQWSKCRNTHNAPRTGVTNFGGYKLEAPTFYMGWEGRHNTIWSKVDTTVKNVKTGKILSSHTMGPRILDNILNTGTGGGWPTTGHDIRIFADDFTEMYNARIATAERALDILIDPTKKIKDISDGEFKIEDKLFTQYNGGLF